MSWTFPANEININARITYGAAWHTVDLGSNNDVPAGTSAVILHITNQILQITNQTPGAGYGCNVRPQGNTEETATGALPQARQVYLLAVLDSSRAFEGYFEDSNLDVRIAAYTPDAFFAASATDKSAASAGSYQTVDVSALAPAGSQTAWFCFRAGATKYNYAIRRKGASYDEYHGMGGSGPQQSLGWAGLDANRGCEQKVGNTAMTLAYWGYGGYECQAITPVEVTPGAPNSWVDCDVSSFVPAGAAGVIVQLVNNYAGDLSGTVKYACVRKKGSTDNRAARAAIDLKSQIIGVVGLDASGIFQAYVTDTVNLEVWVTGYIRPAQTVEAGVSLGAGGAVQMAAQAVLHLVTDVTFSAAAALRTTGAGLLLSLLRTLRVWRAERTYRVPEEE